PHPGGVDLDVARRQVTQRGAVLAVTEDVLDGGAVAVPVLDFDSGLRCRDVEVGELCRARHNSPYAEPAVMPTGWWVVAGFLGVGGVSAVVCCCVLGIITGF